MLNISLTYDYELFLGENNASYDEILFNPTERLSEIMLKTGARGTFFVDVCSALAFKNIQKMEGGGYDYYEKFSKQLQQLTMDGHDVQLHIHSNWYCAKEKDGDLRITTQGYRIHDFGFDETKEMSVQKIISESTQYLESTLRQVKPDYKCVAYRAGGFALQPEKQLLETLVKNGVTLDSSVLPRMKNGGVNYYDYTKAPNKINWWIDPKYGYSVCAEKANGRVFEVPVLCLRPRLLEYMGKRKTQLRLPPVNPKGTYATISSNNKPDSNIKRLFKRLFDYRYVTLDTRYYERVLEDLNYFYKKHGLDKKDAYVSLICHPKIADESRVKNIGRLIEEINKHPDKYKIVTFNEIYKEVYHD